MSNRRQPAKADANRTTALYAIGTFLTLTLIAVAAWAMTRPEAVVSAASAAEAPAATFERISVEDLKGAIDRGEVTVIDVRSIEQYTASHIPGSMHIPVTRIEGEIPYLPKGKPVVTYCTCPAEESSGDAAMILERGGVPARALTGGLEAWTARGYATVTGVQ